MYEETQARSIVNKLSGGVALEIEGQTKKNRFLKTSFFREIDAYTRSHVGGKRGIALKIGPNGPEGLEICRFW